MRKSSTITIDDRGKNLTFRIEEMPATRLEKWIVKALLLLSRARGTGDGKEVSLEEAAGVLLQDGVKALSKIDYDEAAPLLEEMLQCCTRIDGGVAQKCTSDTVDGYIEDVQTLFKLKMEALKLNFSFFTASLSSSSAAPDTKTLRVPKPPRD